MAIKNASRDVVEVRGFTIDRHKAMKKLKVNLLASVIIYFSELKRNF